MRLEYLFDFSCPFAYLGSTQIEAVARQYGAELCWKPMLLGGVFTALGLEGGAVEMTPAKARHNALDMHRWARFWGVPLVMPPGHPQRTVAALRAVLALPEARRPSLIHALYRRYWVSGGDFAARATLEGALAEAGITSGDAERALNANDDPACKQALRCATDDAVARGVFGAPTIFVSGPGQAEEMFWGQDRFEMVEAALGGAGRKPTKPSSARGVELDFWYDFSSPFSYLAATQIEALAACHALSLRWKPMLLGAVFREIGTPNVPLLSFSEAKRRYMARDLDRWARFWQVPFRFTSRFPMRTVKALRLALLAEASMAPLSMALFRALWVDDRDLDDDTTLVEILRSQGLSPSLLGRTQEPAVKERLAENTAEAVRAGVFGAPTFVLRRAGKEELYWGQDRLGLLEAALATE
jgi:2-hydroxychromene-2-carboxylate isomerase